MGKRHFGLDKFLFPEIGNVCGGYVLNFSYTGGCLKMYRPAFGQFYDHLLISLVPSKIVARLS